MLENGKLKTVEMNKLVKQFNPSFNDI